MKKVLTILVIAFGSLTSKAQCGIDFSVSPDDALGPNSVLLSMTGTDAFVGFSTGIDWGDGTPWSIGFETDWAHTYAGPGTYEICLNFVAPDCIQEGVCNSYTLSESPETADLCPITASYSVSGSILTTTISGSGAVSPSLSFHPDILSFIDNPFDFSEFQFIDGHSGTFTYNYAPIDEDATYIFCTSYSDLDEPEECETNDYCSSVTFGSAAAGIPDSLDFLSTIQVFPVPASTFINVHLSDITESTNVTWEIYSISGEIIQRGTLQNQQSTLLLPTSMVPGNYYIKLTSDKKERVVNFVKI
jgi:hypothetical protein